MRVIPLADVGLMTVEQAAEVKQCDASTVRRWASRGEIPVIVVGSGRSAKYLLRKTDVDAFKPGPVGAQKGNQNARKAEVEKPTKSRGRPKKGQG